MSYHFIGLGGIGMSALARILLQKGECVGGSDAADSALLSDLKKEGAKVFVGHTHEALQNTTCVIYSSSIQEGNVELLEAKKRGIERLHRSDLLAKLMQGQKALMVTGTHGKTTTSSLLSHVLVEAGLDPSFAVGGIIRSLATNGRFGKGPYFVAEADESDGSFLKGSPFGAIVTNLEDEHLDYWKTSGELTQGFAQFFSQIQSEKHLFWCKDDPRLAALCPRGASYGFSKEADLQIHSYEQTANGISFSLGDYRNIALPLLGRHNAQNGSAVFALALSLGIAEEKIRNAFASFQGAKRRLERKGEAHFLKLYDDYAHHPTEIRETLSALRAHILERRLVAIFQPHRYSRVRDLFEEFAPCFTAADLVILTDIYAAGEVPIAGITTETLFKKLQEKLGKRVLYIPRERLEEEAPLRPHDVAITLGAGDITKAGDPILRHFQERAPKLRIALLFGGTSEEHEVALKSAENIRNSLDPVLYTVEPFFISKEGEWSASFDALKKCDVAIPVFHGPQGEDGMIQGLLETLQIPYVGCDYRSSALCMEKSWTKQIALYNNVPTARFIEMEAATYRQNPDLLTQKIENNLSFPLWVKPVHLGSSIGVTRTTTLEEVHTAARLAFSLDEKLIVEEEVVGRQVEFALLGNDTVRIGEPSEILSGSDFYDYEKKYGPNATGVEIPAKITELQKRVGLELAAEMYRAASCQGLARIDFFLDQKGHFWLNEINPFPGFTHTSAYPKMWEAKGLSPENLWHELIVLALHKHRSRLGVLG